MTFRWKPLESSKSRTDESCSSPSERWGASLTALDSGKVVYPKVQLLLIRRPILTTKFPSKATFAPCKWDYKSLQISMRWI